MQSKHGSIQIHQEDDGAISKTGRTLAQHEVELARIGRG